MRIVPMIIVYAGIVTILTSTPSYGQALRIDPALAAALLEVLMSWKNFTDATHAASDALLKDPPAPPSKIYNWDDLANNFRSAAKKLESAPLPTEFDQARYSVSLEEYRSCKTQEGAINKLYALVSELDSAVENSKEAINTISAREDNLRASYEAFDYLLSIHEQLLELPFYQQAFLGDWFSLETNLKPALADLDGSLKAVRRRIENELPKVTSGAANLRSNLSWIDTNSCVLVGDWHVRCDPFSAEPFRFDFHLIDSGTKQVSAVWLETYSDENGVSTTTATELTNHVLAIRKRTQLEVKFTLGDDPAPFIFNGTFSPDYSAISGTFSPSENDEKIMCIDDKTPP